MTLEHHLAQVTGTLDAIKIGNRVPLPTGDCTRFTRHSFHGTAFP
jgi:hypothetical protein